MRFEFATATRIVFGVGSFQEVEPAARQLGSRALLVTHGPALEWAAAELRVEGEPAVELVRVAVELARTERCDVVIGLGGGSAIDAGKAVAAMLANPGDLLDYLEVVGRGRPLQHPSVPFIAVPTTAGTGAEVTRNAVLASYEHRVKASLRSPLMLPRLAVVDPELTLDLPPALTAATGLDALTQLIEPFVSARANPMTDVLSREGMRLAARSLVRAYEDGRDLEARTDMSLASLYGGLCLANAGLGAVHGFAAPIGGAFEAPHGAVCAALLAPAMDVNIRALRERGGTDQLGRYAIVAEILTGRAEPDAGVEWTAQVCRRLRIPPLRAYGIGPDDVPALVAGAARASSMQANPVKLTAEEMTELLTRAV